MQCVCPGCQTKTKSMFKGTPEEKTTHLRHCWIKIMYFLIWNLICITIICFFLWPSLNCFLLLSLYCCHQERLLLSLLPAHIARVMKAEIIQRLKGPNCGQMENTNNFHNLYVQRHTNVRHVLFILFTAYMTEQYCTLQYIFFSEHSANLFSCLWMLQLLLENI